MKLRIQGNSIRLRLLQSELKKFVEQGRLEETVHFASDNEAFITYGLEYDDSEFEVHVRYTVSKVLIVVPKNLAMTWAQTEQVGIYSSVEISGHGSLKVVVEKDFACLDLSDAENEDTFPNPVIGAPC
jgi:hypothetical protein